jgi:hypothetical protein
MIGAVFQRAKPVISFVMPLLELDVLCVQRGENSRRKQAIAVDGGD